jgi:hypothetical protein
LTLVAALAAAPSVAHASTIPANCGTCGSHNTSFDISYQLVDDVNNIYKFVVTATYGSSADFTYINAISFKVDSLGSDDYSTTPSVVGPAEDTWTVLSGGINAGGCDGSGAGFWCASSAGKGATHSGVAGTTDTWTFTVDLGNSVPDLGQNETGSFKAEFTKANGQKVGSLISEDVTIHPCTNCGGGGGGPVPEPGSIVLIGTGLVGLAARLRRRPNA